MKGKSILITGAGGFLGSALSEYFYKKENNLILVGRFSCEQELFLKNLFDQTQVFNMTLPDKSFDLVLKKNQIDLLIHCAGTAAVNASMHDPYLDFADSVGVSATVFNSVRTNAQNCKLVIMSSASVYGNPLLLPIDESFPIKPISAYGYHKVMVECLGEEFFRLYEIPNLTLRIFSAYGRGIKRQVVFDLFRKFSDPSLKTVELIGTGEETRDFIHAVDIARGIECLYDNDAIGVFNVASGRQIRIVELANMIKNIVGSSKEICFTGHTRVGDPLYWQADIGKIKENGFEVSVSLEQGLRDYYTWFQAGDERTSR